MATPYLYETPVKIVSAINATSQRAGVDRSTSIACALTDCFPPHHREKFGRRLARLGWICDDAWTPYCKRLDANI